MPRNDFARRNVGKLLWAPRYLAGDLLSRIVPRRPGVWAVGSHFGVRDGARAIVEEARAQDATLRVMWFARSAEEAQEARALGMTPVRRGSLRGLLTALGAEVIVLTHGFGDVSRFGSRGAVVVQLWHGSPLKKMHADSPEALALPSLGYHRVTARLLQGLYRRGGQRISLFPVSSQAVRPEIASAFGVDPAHVEVLGEARTDILFEGDSATRRARAREVVTGAVGDCGQSRLVLFAPTWRDGRPDPVVPTPQEWDRIEQRLRALDAVLLVRPHPYGVGDYSYASDRVRLLDGHALPELMPALPAMDAVVTDYSSVLIDAAVVDCPTVFLAPDLEDYARRHGLYDDYDVTSAGRVDRTWDQALARLADILTPGPGADEARSHAAALAHRYHHHRDGRSAARIVRRILELTGHTSALTSVAPRRTGSVFFESFHGRNVSCNPAAIDRALAEMAPGVERYWSVRSANLEVPDGAHAVVRGTASWQRARARADALVINDWIDDDWRPRRGQLVLQTWHGTPLKRIALARRGKSLRQVAAIVRQSSRWSALLAQSPEGGRLLRRAYAVRAPVWVMGYPRNDLLVSSRGSRVRAQLGVRTPRVVLYAPTWRDGALDALDPLDSHELSARLGEDWTVLVRGHARTMDDRPRHEAQRVLDVTAYPDVSDLMCLADVLVTDYSSVMFDFSATGRPMVFYVADQESYDRDTRGFVMDLGPIAPGPLVRSAQDCARAVAEAAGDQERWAARYSAWRERFNPLDDGQASRRVAEKLLREAGLAQGARTRDRSTVLPAPVTRPLRKPEPQER